MKRFRTPLLYLLAIGAAFILFWFWSANLARYIEIDPYDESALTQMALGQGAYDGSPLYMNWLWVLAQLSKLNSVLPLIDFNTHVLLSALLSITVMHLWRLRASFITTFGSLILLSQILLLQLPSYKPSIFAALLLASYFLIRPLKVSEAKQSVFDWAVLTLIATLRAEYLLSILVWAFQLLLKNRTKKQNVKYYAILATQVVLSFVIVLSQARHRANAISVYEASQFTQLAQLEVWGFYQIPFHSLRNVIFSCLNIFNLLGGSAYWSNPALSSLLITLLIISWVAFKYWGYFQPYSPESPATRSFFTFLLWLCLPQLAISLIYFPHSRYLYCVFWFGLIGLLHYLSSVTVKPRIMQIAAALIFLFFLYPPNPTNLKNKDRLAQRRLIEFVNKQQFEGKWKFLTGTPFAPFDSRIDANDEWTPLKQHPPVPPRMPPNQYDLIAIPNVGMNPFLQRYWAEQTDLTDPKKYLIYREATFTVYLKNGLPWQIPTYQ